MNRIAATLVLASVGYANLYAQEMMVDSINTGKFTGLVQSGEMDQIMYVPYFSNNKADKNNFIIRPVNPHSFNEETAVRLELPDTYELKGSASNGGSYLLCFYDAGKKEDVLMTVVNGNVFKKKSFKSTGDAYMPLNTMGGEGFLLVTISNKGNYNVEMLDMELASKWKKKHTAPQGTSWDVISVKSKMDGLEIIRKENKAGGKYAFVIHGMQTDSGEDKAQAIIGNNDFTAYPTFISEKEGMNFTGGFYFKNSVYSTQPEGVFFAMLMPDGSLSQEATVPYSQVVEDIKSSLGNQFSTGNTTIVFSSGMMLHETQSLIMTGQVITKENKEGGCIIHTGDIVTVKFSMDQKYNGATVVKAGNNDITLAGDVSKTNIIDLGVWLKNASLLQFSHFVNMPGNPIIGYKKMQENGLADICFRNVGLKPDTTRELCMPILRNPQTTANYKYSGASAPVYPVANFNVSTSQHDFINVTLSELHNNLLVIRKVPIPNLEDIRVHILPEPPHHDNPAEDEQPPVEEEKSEG